MRLPLIPRGSDEAKLLPGHRPFADAIVDRDLGCRRGTSDAALGAWIYSRRANSPLTALATANGSTATLVSTSTTGPSNAGAQRR